MSVSFAQIVAEKPMTFTAECPTRAVLDHVMSRWGVLVLSALADGELRWGALRRIVPGISEKMLSQTLKSLERDGLVTRTQYAEIPPRVEYELTETGRELIVPLRELEIWATSHMADILAARERFDADPA